MKRISYDKKAVGKRLQEKRKQQGWDRKYVAGKVGVVEKYYADIERGTCGMSVETLIALTELYGITMDALIYGNASAIEILAQDKALLRELESMTPQLQDTCRQLLVLFVNGIHEGEAEKTISALV